MLGLQGILYRIFPRIAIYNLTIFVFLQFVNIVKIETYKADICPLKGALGNVFGELLFWRNFLKEVPPKIYKNFWKQNNCVVLRANAFDQSL